MNTYISELVRDPWAAWLVIALLAGLLEVVLPYFTFIFVALAALAAAAVAVFGGVIVQVAAFAAMLLASLLILRPRFLHGIKRKHVMHSRSEALIGLTGRVTEAIDPRTGAGRVTVNGQDWAAKARVPLGPESVVSVEGHDGIVLLVKEK